MCWFMSSKFRVRHSRFWCCCVFGIVSKRSWRFTTKVEATKHLDQCHQLHHSFLLCHLKCYENVHAMTTKEGWPPMTLQPSYSQYSFCILVILFRHCFQVRNTSFKNVALFWFTSSFQSFATMGFLWYS
jgi:hypothetical protein